MGPAVGYVAHYASGTATGTVGIGLGEPYVCAQCGKIYRRPLVSVSCCVDHHGECCHYGEAEVVSAPAPPPADGVRKAAEALREVLATTGKPPAGTRGWAVYVTAAALLSALDAAQKGGR